MTRNSLTEAPPKPSKVEEIKTASRQLRGTLQEELARDSDQFGPEDIQLLKFHGTYQQYDRDTATTRKKEGLEKEFSFMLRLRLPGGKLTAAQYLALDNLADKYANGTLRITTRQTIQFHGILKRDLRATIREVNEAVITSFGACGDVVRNVTTNPAPIADYAHRRMDEDAALLSTHLLPRTRAYHDIWIDGEKQETPAAPVDEPLYGEVYLPRKFKIGIATPDDNTVDVLTNDLAVIPLFRDNTLEGYNIAIGGGLGTTHNKPETYPRLATPVAFVGPDDLLGIAEAVISLQRDHGDRSNRRHARLKYTIDDHGLAWVKERLESYFGRALEEPRPMARFRVRDHMGWHEQGDGHWYLGLHVPNGRIADKPGWRLKTALARLFATRELRPIFSTTQDFLIADIPADKRQEIEDFLGGFGVMPGDTPSRTRRAAMACPALPTCGLALTEAERIQPDLMNTLEGLMAKHGIDGERISVRVTGCPNGCARPYVGDIGFVGRMPGHYAIFVGGDFEGTRLNTKLFEKASTESISQVFDLLFGLYARERRDHESFGDFCDRKGVDVLRDYIASESGATTAAHL